MPTRRSVARLATDLAVHLALEPMWDRREMAPPRAGRRPAMDVAEALAFVEEHGVVLVAARGPVPRLTEAIAGVRITGSWWGHPLGHEIYRVLGEVTESPDVLVCRVVSGKVTLVHRRLWPALIRCAGRFAPETLAHVRQVHTAHGHHANVEVPFPTWASRDVLAAARRLHEEEALGALGEWAGAPFGPPRRRSSSSRRHSN